MSLPNIDMEALQQKAQVEQQQKQQKEQVEERRNFILSQILEPAAEERMKRLKLVKLDQANRMADSLVNAATSGQLTQKITDDGLKKMLESGVGADGTEINVQQKIKFQRRKFGGMDSSDDDNDDDLL